MDQSQHKQQTEQQRSECRSSATTSEDRATKTKQPIGLQKTEAYQVGL